MTRLSLALSFALAQRTQPEKAVLPEKRTRNLRVELEARPNSGASGASSPSSSRGGDEPRKVQRVHLRAFFLPHAPHLQLGYTCAPSTALGPEVGWERDCPECWPGCVRIPSPWALPPQVHPARGSWASWVWGCRRWGGVRRRCRDQGGTASAQGLRRGPVLRGASPESTLP